MVKSSEAIVAKTLETDEDYVAAYMDNEHYRLNLDPFKSSIERAWGYMLKLKLFDEGAEDINIDDHINTELYKAALDECILDNNAYSRSLCTLVRICNKSPDAGYLCIFYTRRHWKILFKVQRNYG